MKKTFAGFLAFVVIFVLVFSAILPTNVTAAATSKEKVTESENGIYIIQLINEPVVSYQGDIAGYPGTAPAEGTKIDPLSASVVKYSNFLVNKHNSFLSKTGGRKLYDYVYSFNGFAAKMNLKQANKMANLKGVIAVSPDEIHDVDTSSTPTFLGLDAPGGLWEQLGGTKNAGEGIIIGMIDSGITPQSLSFTDRVNANGVPAAKGTLVFQQIPGWHGKCTPGENFNASMCNQKLIGAQWFNASWGGNAGIDAQRPWEFNSVRDYNGHGTHTASTAGGNYGVKVSGPAAAFGTISGMAPRARIAMYKALWSTAAADTASGANSDLVAAIDQAVRDGVDVISYSISGSQTNFLDPVEIAFMYAANAGIFVATSAGNSGPTISTVAHPSPWVTTVAAGTHNRSVIGSVTLGNGSTYFGPSLATSTFSAPLILSTDAGLPGANATALQLCFAAIDNGGVAVLDPAKVAGKIVVCDRGSNARVNKGLAVMEAGGSGMILTNTSSLQSLNLDFHYLPTVHLASADRAAVRTYAAITGATATINKATMDYSTPAPYTASFSSRGPLIAGAGDLLKPDVIAPGQDILAAVSPASGGGYSFNLYSGTSMSTPHVAGVAAMFKQAHPNWSPMMIKSALMTSAYDILDEPNTNPEIIFRQGAGHIQPNNAINPGLVYNSSWNNWLAFLCGTTSGVSPATCSTLEGMGFSTDPSDLNQASIAIGALAGAQTVERSVTNVGSTSATYSSIITGMAGINVVVNPSSFTLNPGETQKIEITFTVTTAPLNAYTGGYLTLADGTHVVRSPIVVKPVALAAPAEILGNGSPLSFDVDFGFSGAFTAIARGLVPATTIDDEIMTGEQLDYAIPVPAGSTYLRVSLFNANTTAGSDLDLYLFNQAGTQVGSSGGGTSDETISLINPTDTLYYVLVDGYATANPSTFTLFTWVLGGADTGNMVVTAPAVAIVGTTGTINLTFNGLTPATKYLGSIVYDGAAGMPNPTIVRIDVP